MLNKFKYKLFDISDWSRIGSMLTFLWFCKIKIKRWQYHKSIIFAMYTYYFFFAILTFTVSTIYSYRGYGWLDDKY